MSLDSVLRRVTEVFSSQAEKHVANDAVFEVPPVNREDIFRKGHWKNARGETLRVNVEKGTMYEFPRDTEPYYVDLKNTEGLEKILQEREYVFVPAIVQTEAAVFGDAPESGAATMDAAIQGDMDIEGVLTSMEARVELINIALSEAQEIVDGGNFSALQSVLDEIATRVTEAVKVINELSMDDDVTNERVAQDRNLGDHLVSKEARLKKLEEVAEEIGLLEQHATEALHSLRELQSRFDMERDEKRVVATSASHKNVEKNTKKGGSERKKKRSKDQGEEGADISGSGHKKLNRVQGREAKQSGAPLVDTVLPVDKEQEQTLEDFVKQFFKRPENKEVIDTYRMILVGEWEKFTQALERSKKVIPHEQAVDIWEQDERLLPSLRKRILDDLVVEEGIDQEQAEALVRGILADLDQEYFQE